MKDIRELELLKEKIRQEYTNLKLPKLSEISQIENEMNQKVLEVEAQINQIKSNEQLKAEIKDKLAKGQFTSTDFQNLTPEQQELAKEALFDYFAGQINVYHALSAAEFLLIPLAKLVFKCLDTANLTPEEQAFVEAFKAIIDQHPMPINDPNTWELTYADTEVKETIQRRNEYLQTKLNITGSI